MKRSLWIFLAVFLITGCSDLFGPVGWHGHYGTYDLETWDGQAVPTAFGDDQAKVSKGCNMLNTRDRFNDSYSTEYFANNQMNFQTDTFSGTWKLKGDSIIFNAPNDLRYATKFDTLEHRFTLIWLDEKAGKHYFTYQRKTACRY